MTVPPIGTLSSYHFSHFFKRVTAKKYCHRSKWGLIPRNPSQKGDEHRNVLDSIGIKVLYLPLVVMQQPLKELVGGVANPRSWK